MDWANDNAICCENKNTNVFKYEERSASIVRVFPDGKKPQVWTIKDRSDWEHWFKTNYPALDENNSGLILILSRRPGERRLEPIARVKSEQRLEGTSEVTEKVQHTTVPAKQGSGGQRSLRNLPFSEQTFRDITRRFYIHESIARVVNRANIPDFSAMHLEMGQQDGLGFPAYVCNSRTSNAWEGDLAISTTYFPHSNLTFAIMFGCTLSVEIEVLSRLSKITYEACHPLLMPSILAELERKRQLPIIEEQLDNIQAQVLQLDEDIKSEEILSEKERVELREARRAAWLDMMYYRDQLRSWSTCLESLYKHANQLNRTMFSEFRTKPRHNYDQADDDIEFEDISDSTSELSLGPQLRESFSESLTWTHIQCEQRDRPQKEQATSAILERTSYQRLVPQRVVKAQIRRTGTKIQDRLREIIKDYHEKIRECNTGVEGMIMAAQYAQGETSVEIALATGQDSRHMRSIALVTMLFLPGTFFASIFSMGFFEWTGSNGSVVISQYFWIYVILSAGFTALTVGFWWYVGVYRYSKHRQLTSETGKRLSFKIKQIRSVFGHKME